MAKGFKMGNTGDVEQSNRVPIYKVKEGQTDRISILTSQVAIVRVYFVQELMRYVYANDGEFLNKNYKEMIKYIYPVCVYPTDKTGEFVYDKGGELPKGDIKVLPLVLAPASYANMIEKNNILQKKSGSKRSLKDEDILVIPGEKKNMPGGGSFVECTYEMTGEDVMWKKHQRWMEQVKTGVVEYNAKIEQSYADTYETDEALIEAIDNAVARKSAKSAQGQGQQGQQQQKRNLPADNTPAPAEGEDSKTSAEGGEGGAGEAFDPDSFFKNK